MKKIIVSTIGLIGLSFSLAGFALAQGMPAATSTDGNTAREEAEGKAVWDKLQAKTFACDKLTNDNLELLGEYFMGQMAGTAHEAMNNMMLQMMGENNEAQMHITLGKRLSGCDKAAAFPLQGAGFMPMMQMMMGGGMMGGWSARQSLGDGGSNSSSLNNFNNPMMGNWGQNPMGWVGVGSWLVTLTWVVWLAVGVLAAIWLWRQINKK
ncbi:hypothetical protein EPN90_04325 [Patescibacteria group bacterium]|nr:MAG: hypothetical protein EPN90_04325 [Patescibacteria group bacterium]